MVSGPVPSVPAQAVVNTGAAATTTASITPTAGNSYYVFAAVNAGAPFTDTATVSGASLTWTKVVGVVAGNLYYVLYVGYGAAPAAGALTITFSQTPSSGRYLVVEQIHNAPLTTNPVAASASTSGTGTSGTAPLAKPGRCFSFWGHSANEASNAATNWSELFDTATANPTVQIQYTFNDGRGAASSWASNVAYGGITVALVSQANPAYVNEDEPITIIGANAAIIPDEPVAVTTGHWSVD